MNFFKKLTGKGSKSSGCCVIEIKEVEGTQEESCCGTNDDDTLSDVEPMESESACCASQPVKVEIKTSSFC
jgi:hypothetical protein